MVEKYDHLVRDVLQEGNHKPNRTGVDTISTFMQTYSIDLAGGFPLLTTKDMDGFRWKSLIHEFLWYVSGEHHIKNLREDTKIWNQWADEEWNLPTAYGRFWRRYPIPTPNGQLPGEWWLDGDDDWIEHASNHYGVPRQEILEGVNRWVTEENGTKVFDQLKYVIDTLNGDHPFRGPESRRIVVNAWHPANAAVSKLPPCHYTFAFNVQNGKLNVHLTQRSGDIALGIPFNIAAYSLLTEIIAQQTNLAVGEFGHSIVDAHIYCGKGKRAEWYRDNLKRLQGRVRAVNDKSGFKDVKEWLEADAPEETDDGYDHVPGLLEQLSREPRERPKIQIADKPIDDLKFDDIQLLDYESHEGLRFKVAE